MPAIYEPKIIDEVVGIECDNCHEEYHDGVNDFYVDYTFGYGTALDGTQLHLALCDKCLAVMVATFVQNPVFKTEQGLLSGNDVLTLLKA